MATCPSCGANSRTDPTFVVEESLVAKPLGSYSLAGVQVKVSAVKKMVLKHSCGWFIEGHIEGDYFVAEKEN